MCKVEYSTFAASLENQRNRRARRSNSNKGGTNTKHESNKRIQMMTKRTL